MTAVFTSTSVCAPVCGRASWPAGRRTTLISGGRRPRAVPSPPTTARTVAPSGAGRRRPVTGARDGREVCVSDVGPSGAAEREVIRRAGPGQAAARDWSGRVGSGRVESGMVCCGLVWSGLVWSGLVCPGLGQIKVWSGLVWVRSESGLVWSGSDLSLGLTEARRE